MAVGTSKNIALTTSLLVSKLKLFHIYFLQRRVGRNLNYVGRAPLRKRWKLGWLRSCPPLKKTSFINELGICTIPAKLILRFAPVAAFLKVLALVGKRAIETLFILFRIVQDGWVVWTKYQPVIFFRFVMCCTHNFLLSASRFRPSREAVRKILRALDR